MKKTRLLLVVATLCASAMQLHAKVEHLLPKPQQVTLSGGTAFALGRAVSISYPEDWSCPYLERVLTENDCTVESSAGATINVTQGAVNGAYDFTLEGYPNEAYSLEISANAINIVAVTPTGVIRAAQTLSQLAQGYEGTAALEALTMKDWPAFKLRGFMHDVGRSFVSVPELKKQIDALAHFKVNTFHWHFTENQAWRLQIKTYPQLTEAQYMTRFAGQYYTQEQCREVQDYAAERGIMIIPEVDMPGHSAAFERAMGHGMQTDEGVAELKVIIAEVCALFDKSTYIHIGGDEVTITRANFLEDMIAEVKLHGKQAMVWNPIRGVNIGNLDAAMTQMWSTSGTKITGKANIDCRYNYTNHFDVFADLVGIYRSNIYYQQQGDADVPGFLSCPWNDKKMETEDDIIRQNNFYANVIASAERAWRGGGEQYIETGGTMLSNSGAGFDEFADWERRFLFHKATTLSAEADLIPYVKQTHVRWKITDGFPNGGDAATVFPPEESEEMQDVYAYNGTNYGVGTATGAGIYLSHVWPTEVPTYFGKNAALNQTAYAWTYVYSENAQDVGALIEFQNYGRSEANDKAPAAGNWDRKGSKIYLNGTEIPAPTWTNPDGGSGAETNLTNENFTGRAPVQLHLNAGWNKVFLKLPYVSAPNIRLNKWMFTFVLTDKEGKNALEDVIYSPSKCIDANAEQVATKISEVRRDVYSKIGTKIGYYPASVAEAILAKLTEIESTLSNAMTADERTAQITEITNAKTTFDASLSTAARNLPISSTETETHYYSLKDKRGGKYAISGGAGNGVTGSTSAGGAYLWKFVQRTGTTTFDIINTNDNSYLNPASAANNTQLKTSATQPTDAWSLTFVDGGYAAIISKTVQLHQSKDANVLNWGGGSNTTDGGCLYTIEEVEYVAPEALPEALGVLSNITLDGTAPYKVKDDLASAIMAAGTVTVAVNYSLTNNSSSAEQCLFGSSNSGATASFSCLNAIASNNDMIARTGTGGNKYTLSDASGTDHAKVVLVMSTTGYKQYINGSLSKTITHNACRNLGSYDGANGLYLGGLVTSDNTNMYPMTGTIHSIQFFPGELTAEQIAMIEYPQPETIAYTIDKTNGDNYRDGTTLKTDNTWCNTWKSKNTIQLTFGTGSNNMQWSGNNLNIASGGSSSTYTLTPPEGYYITDYSFTFVNNGHSNALTITMDNGKTHATSTTEQTVSVSDKQLTNMSFVLSGANNPVLLKNFTVNVKRGEVTNELPQISTEGDVHWYYIINASSNKDYCRNKVIYYNSNSEKLQFAPRAYQSQYIWSFWKEGDKIAIKNYNGEYFGTAGSGTGNNTAFGVVSTPNYIYNIEASNGAFIIKDSGTELHAQEDNSVIVRWGVNNDGAASASLWKFEEVDISDAQASVESTVVEQGKVTTGIGNKDQGIVRATLRIGGLEGTCHVGSIQGKFTGTNAADVTKVKVYVASNDRELNVDADNKMTWRDENGELCDEGVLNTTDNTFSLNINKDFAPGNHYVWIAYDIAETAKEGNTVDAQITSYVIDDATRTEANGNPAHAATVFLSEGTVLIAGDKGSTYYRIPSITVTKDGNRLVTLTDDRKNHNADLPSHCYLVAQYSDDLGKTWSDPVTVAGTETTGGNYGHGDASIVTNRDNGDIIGIMTSSPHGKGYFYGDATQRPAWKTIVSHDNGLTWEAPVDHTDNLYGAYCSDDVRKTWKSGFSGSGAALQKRDGTLVSSFTNREADDSQHFYLIMSKDGGQNWYVSGTSGTTRSDEPKTLERNNGDLAISVRASGYNYHNVTSDEGVTWKNNPETRFTTGITGNACDGEYMVWCSTVEGNPWDIAFQTLPNSGSRQNVSIALSTDEGETFGTPKTLCPRGSAYSAAVVLPDGTLGVYYEENSLSAGYTMRFIRFSLDWASDGTYKFTENSPFHPIKSTADENTNTNANDITSAILPACESELALAGKVGYPTATGTAKTAFQEAYNAASAALAEGSVSMEQYSTLVSTRNTYKSTADIVMPENGKAYTITAVNQSGTKAYLYYKNETDGYRLAQDDVIPETGHFICRTIDDNGVTKYVFTNIDGKYFVWKGKEGENSNKGYADTYHATYSPVWFKKQTEMFGALYMVGRRPRNNGELATLVLNNALGETDFNANSGENGQVLSGSYTSALLIEEVDSRHTVNFTELEENFAIATYSAPYPTVIPEDVTPYIIASVDGETALAKKIEGTVDAIPANMGVILATTAEGTKNLAPATTETVINAPGENMLIGTGGQPVTITGTAYILDNGTQGIGLYRVKPNTAVGTFRAYLDMSESESRLLKIVFDNGLADGISQTEAVANATTVYDLSGRVTGKTLKRGLYIKGGKKFIVK